MKTEQCSQCKHQVDEGTEICPNCGNFLPWDDADVAQAKADSAPVIPGVPDAPPAVQTDPGQAQQAPPDPSFVAPSPIPQVIPPKTNQSQTITCSVCNEVNPADRTWCQRCGSDLHPPDLDRASSGSAKPLDRRLLAAIIGATVAVVAVIGFLIWPPDPDVTTTTIAAVETTSTLPPKPMIATGVSAIASSEGTAGQSITYVASNTLDGSDETAWNHCNSEAQQCSGGEASTLMYTFPEPVELVRLEIKNGYWKVATDGDRFAQNSRIAAATLVTDTGRSFPISFPNERTITSIEEDFGVVRSVTITIDSTYPGSEWIDLAVNEVTFWVLPVPEPATSTTAP